MTNMVTVGPIAQLHPAAQCFAVVVLGACFIAAVWGVTKIFLDR